jgi:hypothetical protein
MMSKGSQPKMKEDLTPEPDTLQLNSLVLLKEKFHPQHNKERRHQSGNPGGTSKTFGTRKCILSTKKD